MQSGSYMDVTLKANERTARQAHDAPAAKPIANIRLSSSFNNFHDDVVVDLVGTGDGGPDDVFSGLTEENPTTCTRGLEGICVELWRDSDVEEFSDQATVAALP